MVRFLKWLVGDRRPNEINDTELVWHLFGRLTLTCQFKSEDRNDYRPIERSMLMLLVAGDVLYYESPHPHEKYITRPHLLWLRKNLRYHIELLEAETYEDAMLDMPGWMGPADLLRNTDKQAWFLAVML